VIACGSATEKTSVTTAASRKINESRSTIRATVCWQIHTDASTTSVWPEAGTPL
jgi:hypothetical protein